LSSNPVLPYILDQAYVLALPGSNKFTFWPPWVKGYNGEVEVGYMGSCMNYPKFLWADPDLKEKMTGRKQHVGRLSWGTIGPPVNVESLEVELLVCP